MSSSMAFSGHSTIADLNPGPFSRTTAAVGDPGVILSPYNDWMEWQAGYAGGGLLMPISPLRDIVESSLSEWGVAKFVRSSSEHYSELVERIANTFSVSKDAAGVRITKLGYVAPASPGK